MDGMHNSKFTATLLQTFLLAQTLNALFCCLIVFAGTDCKKDLLTNMEELTNCTLTNTTVVL